MCRLGLGHQFAQLFPWSLCCQLDPFRLFHQLDLVDLLRHFLPWDLFGLWGPLGLFAPCLQLNQSTLEGLFVLYYPLSLYYLYYLFDRFGPFGRFDRWHLLNLLSLLRQLNLWHLLSLLTLCDLLCLCLLCLL